MSSKTESGTYIETRLRTFRGAEKWARPDSVSTEPIFSDLSEWVERFRRLNGGREGAA